MVDIKELRAVASSFSILYVEDEKEIAQSFIAYLSKFFKEVVYAENGQQGLELYQQQNFDLVLTDINMPIMNGLDMARKMKEINTYQNIVIISAYSDIDKFVTSIKLGIDGYIIKPINYTDMNSLLFKLCNKIKKFQENDINAEQQKVLLDQISRNNTQLRQYTEVIDHVALVSKTDLKGNIKYVNDFFVEISGYSKDELIGSNQSIVRHPEMAKSVFKELWETIKLGETWKGSIKNRSKDGKSYFIHATIIPLYEKDEINEYIGISFLTTEEENKKRDFKKKVMMGYQEFRKHSLDSSKRIEELEKEIKTIKEEELFQNNLINELKVKNKKFVSQINFYEEELEKKDLKFKRALGNSKTNSQSVTDAYKKSVKQLDTQKDEMIYLRKDNKSRLKEIDELTTKLNEQSVVIRDLRDTIKNINEDEKAEAEKAGEEEKGHFWNK